MLLAAFALGTRPVLVGWVAGISVAILAMAATFQPAPRPRPWRSRQSSSRPAAASRPQWTRRFNRRRHDAARTIAAFNDRLRDEVDLDTRTGEVLAVVDQTMQPSQASLWLRPSLGGPAGRRERVRRCPDFRPGDPGCDAEAASGEPAWRVRNRRRDVDL